MDVGTIVGLLVAAAAIVLGLLLEGGKVGQILQPTAALIVFGGTFGAILVQFPITVVLAAVRSLPAAGKLRMRVREEQIVREMMLEGVISLLEGMNPRMIETKLDSFLTEMPSPEKEKEKEEVSA